MEKIYLVVHPSAKLSVLALRSYLLTAGTLVDQVGPRTLATKLRDRWSVSELPLLCRERDHTIACTRPFYTTKLLLLSSRC